MQHYRPDQFDDERRLVKTERVENYDSIYIHDAAVLNYFSFWTLIKDKATHRIIEKRVPTVFATPRREWSMADERATAMEWEGSYDPTQLERIIYPSISVTRLDIAFDITRWEHAKCRKLKYSSDLNLILQSGCPLPYTFSYQFDFWVLEQAHFNEMAEQWIRYFPSPTIGIDVTYPPPWGVQNVHIQPQGSFGNISTYEGGEQQRELRGSATLNVFGWIPLPTTWVRTVQKFSLDMVEESSQEILIHLESDYADKKKFFETGDKDDVMKWE